MKRDKVYDSKSPFQTIPDATRTTGLSQYYLRTGCVKGTVPHIKCGMKYMINVPALLEMLNADSMANFRQDNINYK